MAVWSSIFIHFNPIHSRSYFLTCTRKMKWIEMKCIEMEFNVRIQIMVEI